MCPCVTSARSCIEKLVWGLLCSGEGKLRDPSSISAAPRALLVLWPGCQHRGSNRASRTAQHQGQMFISAWINIYNAFLHHQWRRGGEGFLRTKWRIPGKTAKPAANTGVSDKEKGMPDSTRPGEYFSSNLCCFLPFTKDVVFWVLQAKPLTDKPSVWEEAGFECDFKCLHWTRDNMYPSREECIRNCVIGMELCGNWIQREMQNKWTAEMKNLKRDSIKNKMRNFF